MTTPKLPTMVLKNSAILLQYYIKYLTKYSSRNTLNSNKRLFELSVFKIGLHYLEEVVVMENETRSKLIEIATELFATKGFAAVSVRELTVAAQINVSAISYYFSGKEGLYEAVLTEQLSPILQALRLVQSNTSLSPIARLKSYADQIAHIHAQRPFLARFITSEITNPTEYGSPIVEKHLSQAYQFMAAALREGIARGDLREDLDVTYAAVSLAGILNFYFITKPLVQKSFPVTECGNSEAEYIAQAFHVYLYGVMNPSE
jgi:TetR/AcrR family transcriptional regulator